MNENRKRRQVEEQKLWSIGQHNGLLTPLIDFTIYPYHALFFAFAEREIDETVEFRAVYAINQTIVKFINHEIIHDQGINIFNNALRNPPYDENFRHELLMIGAGMHTDFSTWVSTGSPPETAMQRLCEIKLGQLDQKTLKIYHPSSNENKRIHAQGGLHIYSNEDVSIETWVRRNYALIPLYRDAVILTKLLIPNHERCAILSGLNNMNINYLTIYPDMEGAARHCNLTLEMGHLSKIRGY